MEWTIVTVIAALVGLFAAVAKPLINFKAATVENTCAIKALTDVMTENKAEHEKIWDKLDEQGEKLSDHDKRLTVIEKGVAK